MLHEKWKYPITGTKTEVVHHSLQHLSVLELELGLGRIDFDLGSSNWFYTYLVVLQRRSGRVFCFLGLEK